MLFSTRLRVHAHVSSAEHEELTTAYEQFIALVRADGQAAAAYQSGDVRAITQANELLLAPAGARFQAITASVDRLIESMQGRTRQTELEATSSLGEARLWLVFAGSLSLALTTALAIFAGALASPQSALGRPAARDRVDRQPDAYRQPSRVGSAAGRRDEPRATLRLSA